VRLARDKLVVEHLPEWRKQGLPIAETRAAVTSEVQLVNTLLRAYLDRRGYVKCGELFGVGGGPAEGVVDGTLNWACE